MRTLFAPSRLCRAWVVWCTLGEAVGFCVPIAAVAVGASPALVVAGMAEGAILGLAQAHVLLRAIPGLSSAWWVVATSAAAGVAWTIGLTLWSSNRRSPRGRPRCSWWLAWRVERHCC